MKLKNKKTGEIAKLVGYVKIVEGRMFFRFEDDKGTYKKEYNSLAELNEEWEDYEEDDLSQIIEWINKGLEDEVLTISVNDFVEKLKAWKRLKDGGFVFCGKGDCLDTIKFDYGQAGYNRQDFYLLFGGKE